MISLKTFKGGIHPQEYKDYTAKLPIERIPFCDEYFIPLSQHIGAPSISIVEKGQRVKRGEKIAEPGGFVSVAQHSPVDGIIEALDMYDHPNGHIMPALKVKTDRFSTQKIEKQFETTENLDPVSFVKQLQQSGIVGLGGAAFPTHVKFSVPKGKSCRYLILNGCECEPFLTADHRVMLEKSEHLLAGAQLIGDIIQAESIFIGIEKNKADAIHTLQQLIKNSHSSIKVFPLKVKYPQGAEKMLIKAITGLEVPSGKLPLDVETIVSNISTVVSLAEYFTEAKPLIERVITVTGPGVKRPANLMVPIGTPIKEVLKFCGGLHQNTQKIILGGPMMGPTVKSLNTPIVKGTSGITVLPEHSYKSKETFQCIRCGRCLEACPLALNPSILGLLSRKELYDDMVVENLWDCMECACCSFCCPSGIPLVQSFRVAKGLLRQKGVN